MAPLELYTTTTAAEYLGISRQHAHSLTKQGYGTRYGSVWMFTRAELDRWATEPAKGPGGRPSTRERPGVRGAPDRIDTAPQPPRQHTEPPGASVQRAASPQPAGAPGAGVLDTPPGAPSAGSPAAPPAGLVNAVPPVPAAMVSSPPPAMVTPAPRTRAATVHQPSPAPTVPSTAPAAPALSRTVSPAPPAVPGERGSMIRFNRQRVTHWRGDSSKTLCGARISDHTEDYDFHPAGPVTCSKCRKHTITLPTDEEHHHDLDHYQPGRPRR